MARSLKQQAIVGVSWSAIERFSVQGVNFILQIVLARLLLPSDYGMIGMLAIFIQVSQVFIDSGLANALIQKTDCSKYDYSTVLVFNIVISSFIYLLLFFTAPLISAFYNEQTLIPLLRVLSLTLVINAISIIHKTILVKRVDFRTQTKISLVGSVTSGIIGVICAYHGLGVWSLCVQQILNAIIQTSLLIITVKWSFNLIFSNNSFRSLFGFGSKLLIASLIGTVYRNVYTLVIGKVFSSQSLGYYTRAEHFVMFPSNNLANIVARVAFPIFSKIKEDNNKLKNAYSKTIGYSSFIIFPLMIGLLSLSKPFIIVLLTEKWIEAVPIMQILCLDWMLDHISVINLNLLYVKGRSDLALKLEIIKKTIAIIILFSSIPFGLLGMCWGRFIYSCIATILNTFYTHKLLSYSFLSQLKDFFPFLLASAVMGISIYIVNLRISSSVVQLILGCVFGVVVYSLITLAFFRPTFYELKQLVLGMRK